MYKLIGFFALIVACQAAFKVPVTVYYESLCPDSAEFITNQIYPAVKNGLKDYIDITWVPYGKSSHVTQGSNLNFTCHHGPNECYGNKVHSCAVTQIQANSYEAMYTRESLILDFVTCLMRAGKNFPDNKYPGAQCAKDSHVNNWDSIASCANSTEGEQLLKKNGEKTNMYQSPLLSVPSVVFNEQPDKQVENAALKDFRSTLCSKIPAPKPQVCTGRNSAIGLIVTPFLTIIGYLLSKLL